MANYFKSKEFLDTLARYEESQRAGESCYFDSEDFVDFSDYYLDHNKPDESLKAVQSGLLQHPDDTTLKCMEGGLMIYQHHFEEAKAIVNSLGDEEQLDVAYLNAQLTYALDKDVEKADRQFRAWLKQMEKEWSKSDEDDDDFDPEEADNAIRDAYIHVMMSFIELSDIDHDAQLRQWAEDYIERFQPLGKNEADFTLADIVRDSEFIDLVIKVYTMLLENDPYMKDGWTILAAAQHYNGDIEDALNSLEFALAINPKDLDAIATKAHCLYDKKQYKDALHWFLKYIKKDRSHLDDRYVSYCYLMMDDVYNALIYLDSAKKALKKNTVLSDSTKGWALYDIAEQYIHCQHYLEAKILTGQVLKLLPNQFEPLMLRATVLLATKEVEEAIGVYSKALSLTEHVPSTLISIGARFLTFDLCEIAVSVLEVALSFPADDPNFQNRNYAYPYLALAYYRINKLDESFKYLKQACDICPELVKSIISSIPDNLPQEEYFDWLTQNEPS